MKTVLHGKDSALNQVLYMAMELSDKKWKLGFHNGEKQRIKTIEAGNWSALLSEIAEAKARLKCVNDCLMVSCYEAGCVSRTALIYPSQIQYRGLIS